ncbi:UNVERIFIED_CONTAM: hypothetical protein Sradi_4659600 [Sesamum radiatum]|uniref:DUF4283 domain-containing protein n=1 Tax=Sesamum radiatum TaxID=300843 RepID=A0AAW2MT09_SESRA
MRVFKWSPTFTPDQESSIVPVWVNFSELPAHLFHKDAIFSIASIVGTPLQMADSTYNQSKFSRARVCIEIDLLKPLLEDFDIQIQDRKIIQKIEYEKIPHYCSLCKHVGHQALECYSKGDASKPPPRIRINGKNKSEAGNDQIHQQKMKGKMAMQLACKVFDKRLARKEPTFLERGESSKTAEERHRYASVDLLNEDLDNNFQSAAENEIAHSSNYVVTTDIEICRKDGGRRESRFDSVFRLLQTLKQVGVVIKGIKEDVEEAIKRNRLAVSSAILFQKCVLLYDPVRQMNIKPLDTGEHLRQVLQDYDSP